MIHEPMWKVNRNGNTANDIRDDYEAMHRAVLKLEEAMARVHYNSLHGRNYQTVNRPQASREQDVDRLKKMMQQVADIREHAMRGVARAVIQREGL